MRRLALVLLLVLVAGCTRPADDPPLAPSEPAASEASAPAPTPTPSAAPSPTPAPTPTPTPSPTPATPTPATPTPPTPTAPTPAPVGLEVYNGSFDFSTGEALLPLQASDAFDVPAGYRFLVVVVRFSDQGSAQVTDTTDRTVDLFPPAPAPGAAVLGPPASVGTQGGNTTGTIRAPATEGEWTLGFRGQGPTLARIEAKVYVDDPEL